MAPPSACDSAVVPCFHGSSVFLRRYSLLQISSLPSPQPIAVLAPGLFSNPHAPAPSPLHTCEHTSQSRARRTTVWTICVFLTLSHLPQFGHFTLFPQPQMLPFCPNRFPRWRGVSPNLGISPLLQLPRPRVQVPSCFLSSSSSFLFFILPSYTGIFIVLSSVQDLLLVFSQCSVRMVASIDVFLMCPWREMDSTSSYSSAILTPYGCSLLILPLHWPLSEVAVLYCSLILIHSAPCPSGSRLLWTASPSLP